MPRFDVYLEWRYMGSLGVFSPYSVIVEAADKDDAWHRARAYLAVLRGRIETAGAVVTPLEEPEPRHDPDAPSVNEQAQRSYYDKYYGS